MRGEGGGRGEGPGHSRIRTKKEGLMDCVYRRREDRRGRNPLDELPSNESALCGREGGGFVFLSFSLSLERI